MKHPFRLILFFILLFFSKPLVAQHLFKIGPSFMYNVSFFDEIFYASFGGEISYEFGIGRKFSLNTALIFHRGQHENPYTNPPITQTDFLTGIQPEFRIYFKERYNGGYFGIGGDIQYFFSKNYFEPDSVYGSNFSSIEVNFGLSLGFIAPINKENLNFNIHRDLYVNPILYIGFNPSDFNEYELHARLGLNFGF